MSAPYRGPFCSEVTFVPPDFDVADCVAAGGVDIVRAAGMRIPVHAREREALRVASGDTSGGMTLEQLRIGIKNRYGLTARMFRGKPQIEAAFASEYALAGMGRYDSLPRDWWWQKTGDFLHVMFFNRNNEKTRWRSDPLAPASNLGAAMPNLIVRSYLASAGWQALGLLEGSAAGQNPPNDPGDDMLRLTSLTPVLVDIVKGKQLYDLAGKKLVVVSVTELAQVSPYEVEISKSAHYRLVDVVTGGVRQAVLLHNPDANIRPVPPIPPDVNHTVTLSVDGVPKCEVKV